MSGLQRNQRRCPRCDAAMGRRDRWCPECGHGEADEEQRYLLGTGVADAVAVVAALALPMIALGLVTVIGSPVFGLTILFGYLPTIVYLLLLIGFFSFFQPFRTIRKTIAWVTLLWSLPTAFVSGGIALTTGALQLWIGLITVVVLAFQGLLFRLAYGRR